MKKRNILKSSITRLSVCAMLVGISIVIGSVCRTYLTFSVFVRITFENLPIILSGILFGPIYGFLVGLCSDLVSCVVTGQNINIIITAGAASVGLIAGMFSVFLSVFRKNVYKNIIPCVAAHVVGCMFIKTFGLHVYYFSSTSFWYLFGIRAAVYTLIAAAESVIIILIMKNKFIKEFSDYEL